MISPKKIFCCYAHKDQQFLLELKNHLSPLQRQGLIDITADIDISPGANWENEISQHLNTSQIILLLVSPEFIASSYCYTKEMEQALKRHKQGGVCVIPIIVRSVYWKETPLGELQALPKGAKPIKDWSNRDKAYVNVVEEIRLIVGKLSAPKSISTQSANASLANQKVPLPTSNPLSNSSVPLLSIPSPNQKPPSLLPSLPTNQKSSFSSFHPMKNTRLESVNMSSSKEQPAIVANQPTNQQISFPILNPPKSFPMSAPFPEQQTVFPISTTQPPTFPSANPLISQSPSFSVSNTPVNQLSFPSSNSSVNPQSFLFAPNPSKDNVVKKIHSPHIFKNGLFIIFKVTLYFIGAFCALFGFSGGAMYAVEPNQNLANAMVTIAFLIGLVGLGISIIVFFKKQYYRYRLSRKKYALLTTGATVGLLIGGVLVTTLVPGSSTTPPQGLAIGIVLFLYGLFLIVIVHLKSPILPNIKI